MKKADFLYLRPAGGFTLLEVMVAMVILATAFTAVLRLHADSMDMLIESRLHTRSVELAQLKMTEIEIKGVQEISAYSGTFPEIAPDYLWEIEIEPAAVAPWNRVKVYVRNRHVKGKGVSLTSYMLAGELTVDSIRD